MAMRVFCFSDDSIPRNGRLKHPEEGEHRAVIDQWTPNLGENDLEVFHGILGMGESELKRLQETQVIFSMLSRSSSQISR